MVTGINALKFVLLVLWVGCIHRTQSVIGACEFSFFDGEKVYNFSLAAPRPNYPHGVLSEDGFYKVAAKGTVIWFQLCDGMIFNHNPPRCFDCLECGGPSRCGLECSALVADNLGGYDVCTAIGYDSSTSINILDKHNPTKGVIVRMARKAPKHNCSLSVTVICDSKGVKGPDSLEKIGACDYAAVLKHPSGCATSVSNHGKGWGWFGTLIIIMACLFGGYLLAGTVYRYFFLGIRGLDIIPNLDFWARLPQKIQSSFASLMRKLRGPTEGYRSSYSPVNF